MEHVVYEMNKIACELAVDAAKEITAKEPSRPRLVAGAIGPTNRTLSISPSVEDPGFRNCTWDEVVAAYKTQVKGLIDGGCHIILVETIFDTLNAKAALYAIDEYYEESGCPAPAGDDLRHHCGHVGSHALGADDRGLLHLDAACQAHLHWPQLCSWRRPDAAVHAG